MIYSKPPAQKYEATAQAAFKEQLQNELDNLASLLISKNHKYGDAALNPSQIFSTASPLELINIRIDDKISRIKNRKDDEDEDVDLDLIGYLILRRIAKKRTLCTSPPKP